MLEEMHIALPEAPADGNVPRMLPEIYQRLGEACADEAALQHGWISLGALLLRYRDSKQWQDDGFESFDTFMETLRQRFKRGRTQLRSYLGVAEFFLPTISEADLEAIGVSNALEMRRASKLAGKPVPEELVLAARDLTTKELRAKLAESFHITNDEKGTWFDLQGCFFTADQRKEFKDAVKVAMKVLGIKPSVPDHIARAEIMLAFANEFFGTHAPEVYGHPEMFTVDANEEAVWCAVDSDNLPVEIFKDQKEAIASGLTIMEWPCKLATEIIRRAVFMRDKYTCTNCRDKSLTWTTGHMHERLHRGQGGNISIANSVTLCNNCHQYDEEAGHGKRQPQWSAGGG